MFSNVSMPSGDGGLPAKDTRGGRIHPLRTPSANKASPSTSLLRGLGGESSATTLSRSVTNTVSPCVAMRIYSLKRLFNTFMPTARID